MSGKSTFHTLSHIRENPVMYLGGNSNHDNCRQIYCLLRYLLNVAARDFMVGYSNRCELSVFGETQIDFHCFGKKLTQDAIDIILDKQTADISEIDPVHISGNPALPVKIAVALSEKCRLFTGTQCFTFNNGQAVYCGENSKQKASGFHLYLTPSREIFRDFIVDREALNELGDELASIYRGMFFAFVLRTHFSYFGLSDLMDRIHSGDSYYHPAPFDSIPFSFVFTHDDNVDRKALVFINGIEMHRTGPLLNAFVKGLRKAVNLYFNSNYTEAEVCAGLRVCLSLHTDSTASSSQDLENVVEYVISDYFLRRRFVSTKGLHLKLKENRQNNITGVNDWYATPKSDS